MRDRLPNVTTYQRRRWPHPCVVECECGHRSYGHFFGAVWLEGKSRPWRWDAWKAWKRHVERRHNVKYLGMREGWER